MARSDHSRVSGSFGAEELEAGDALLRALLVGADHRVIMRNKHFARFARSVMRLCERAKTCPVKPKPASQQRREQAVALLVQHGTLARRDLAAHMGISADYASELLTQLQRAGQVERVGIGHATVWQVQTSHLARLA